MAAINGDVILLVVLQLIISPAAAAYIKIPSRGI